MAKLTCHGNTVMHQQTEHASPDCHNSATANAGHLASLHVALPCQRIENGRRSQCAYWHRCETATNTTVQQQQQQQHLRDAWHALGVPAFVCISLQERPERAAAAAAEFQRHGLAEHVWFYRPCKDTSTHVSMPGARGCWESHRAVAQWALCTGYDRVLVFEDDVVFSQRFTVADLYRVRDALRALDAHRSGTWRGLFLGHLPWFGVPCGFCADLFRVRTLCLHAYIAARPLLSWMARTSYDAANHCRRTAPTMRKISSVATTAARPRPRPRDIDAFTLRMPGMYAVRPMFALQSGAHASDNVQQSWRVLDWFAPKTALGRERTSCVREAVTYDAWLVLTLVAVGVLIAAMLPRRACLAHTLPVSLRD